jgi:hypothetical protein
MARALWVSNFGQLFRCAQDNLDAIERTALGIRSVDDLFWYRVAGALSAERT